MTPRPEWTPQYHVTAERNWMNLTNGPSTGRAPTCSSKPTPTLPSGGLPGGGMSAPTTWSPGAGARSPWNPPRRARPGRVLVRLHPRRGRPAGHLLHRRHRRRRPAGGVGLPGVRLRRPAPLGEGSRQPAYRWSAARARQATTATPSCGATSKDGSSSSARENHRARPPRPGAPVPRPTTHVPGTIRGAVRGT